MSRGSVAAHPPFEVIHQTKVKMYIDDLKIWDFELNETEARGIYEKGRKFVSEFLISNTANVRQIMTTARL